VPTIRTSRAVERAGASAPGTALTTRRKRVPGAKNNLFTYTMMGIFSRYFGYNNTKFTPYTYII